MNFPLDHTSYSQLKLYEHCPRCYYLTYHLKVQTPKKPELEFGSSVHNAIASYHQFGVKPNNLDRQVKKILDIYADHYRPDFLDEVEKGMLVTFRHPDTNEPLQQPFKLYIDGLRLGYLNRIYEHKTSAFPYNQARVNSEWQATLYAYAFRMFYGIAEHEIIYNVFVKPNGNVGSNYRYQKFHTKRDRSDFANFWYWGHNLLDQIARGHFEPSNHMGWKCDRCKICTVY